MTDNCDKTLIVSLFQAATNLNDEGINALVQGDHDTAIDSMGKAIHLMKTALSCYQEVVVTMVAEEEQSHCRRDDDQDDDIVRSSSSSSLLQQQDSNNSSSTNANSSSHSTDTVEIPTSTGMVESLPDSTFVFNQAIRISTTSTTGCCSSKRRNCTENGKNRTTTNSLPSELAINIYTSAIIFNLALAHQVKAYSSFSFRGGGGRGSSIKTTQENKESDTTTSSNRTTGCTVACFGSTTSNASEERAICTIRAEKLYTMALKLLNSTTAYLTSHTALLVKLACMNNLAQIRYSKGDYNNNNSSSTTFQEELKQEISNLFYQNLSSSSSSSSAAAQAAVITLLENSYQIQELLMSILLFKAPVIAAAA